MKGSEFFPVNEYYRDNIVDAITISRSNFKWVSIVLINKPSSLNSKFIKLYKWIKKDNQWKVSEQFKFKNKREVYEVIEALSELKNQL